MADGQRKKNYLEKVRLSNAKGISVIQLEMSLFMMWQFMVENASMQNAPFCWYNTYPWIYKIQHDSRQERAAQFLW